MAKLSRTYPPDYILRAIEENTRTASGGGTSSSAVNSENSRVAASPTAGTLAIARTTRKRLVVKNTDAAITIYVGSATVTAANGMPLLAGESIELRAQILYQVIAASGAPSVAIVDEYD